MGFNSGFKVLNDETQEYRNSRIKGTTYDQYIEELN